MPKVRHRTPHYRLCWTWLLLLSLSAAAQETPEALRARFAREVTPRLQPPPAEAQHYATLARKALRTAGIRVDHAQYLLLVDRSPHVQAALLFWLDAADQAQLIGATPVSTGRVGRVDYFETPTGVFAHAVANPDFRAEGTFNEHGIRGFGLQGMRVFDFGWQQGRRGWGEGGMSRRADPKANTEARQREGSQFSTMRLLLHATDPDKLEPLLGSVQSKGCVRIPATFNRLLDQHGVLDADYEAAARTGQRLWVLAPRRTPVPDAGRYMVIVDSERKTRPSWSPAPGTRPRTATR